MENKSLRAVRSVLQINEILEKKTDIHNKTGSFSKQNRFVLIM